MVKEAARPADSPAHGFVFNLPPDRAAEEYYTARAHKLIQTIRVQVATAVAEPPRFVRFFHAVSGSAEALYTYEPLESVLDNAVFYAQARGAALRRLREAGEAVRDLEAAAEERRGRGAGRRRRRTAEAADHVERAADLIREDVKENDDDGKGTP